jgi:hypothetical protein
VSVERASLHFWTVTGLTPRSATMTQTKPVMSAAPHVDARHIVRNSCVGH